MKGSKNWKRFLWPRVKSNQTQVKNDNEQEIVSSIYTNKLYTNNERHEWYGKKY